MEALPCSGSQALRVWGNLTVSSGEGASHNVSKATGAPAKRGRKPKYSSEELERRTLAAAVDAVITDGVSAGVDAIRIEKVIIDAEAPRGATYDLWDSKGDSTSQQNLRRAAVIDIIRNRPAGEVQALSLIHI